MFRKQAFLKVIACEYAPIPYSIPVGPLRRHTVQPTNCSPSPLFYRDPNFGLFSTENCFVNQGLYHTFLSILMKIRISSGLQFLPVRLKAFDNSLHPNFFCYISIPIGTIKRTMNRKTVDKVVIFQFLLVRLKANRLPHRILSAINFNSYWYD